MYKGILQARCGDPEPKTLKPADIFFMIDAGKDRKRVFLKQFPSGSRKDSRCIKPRKVMLWISQETFRKRRKVAHGYAKLTQSMVYITSTETKIPAKEYEHFPGMGTTADIIGPLELDPVDSLHLIPQADRVKWWGRHLVADGGHDSADDNDDMDKDNTDEEPPEDEPADAAATIPPSVHGLPDVLPLDVCKAFNVKHVLDISPCSPSLVVNLVGQASATGDSARQHT